MYSIHSSYPIYIGRGLIDTFPVNLTDYSQRVIICDETVADLHSRLFEAVFAPMPSLIVLPPGECNKTIETTGTIWEKLKDLRCDRRAVVLNIGGGVVGDMGGFAASCYMRGIDFVQVPTTLLAQVDASVGGKLGIDFAGVKNLIGTFQDPKAVVVDVLFLETLPKRELASGMAEVLKHALIRDAVFLKRIAGLPSLESFLVDSEDHVYRSLEIKAAVVRADPRESGLRKILNFGHTIGHALESLLLDSDSRLLHGEAVALGMLAELRLGELLGISRPEVRAELAQLLPRLQLPLRLPRAVDPERALALMLSDKKNSAGAIRFSIVSDVGDCRHDVEADKAQILQALQAIAA